MHPGGAGFRNVLQGFRTPDGDEVPETERSPQNVFPAVVQR